MIDFGGVRSLLAIRPADHEVISVYMSVPLDPRQRRSLPARVEDLFAGHGDRYGDSGAWARARREELPAMRDWVTSQAHAWLGHSVAIFACHGIGLLEAVPLRGHVAERAVIGCRPYVRPLMAELCRSPGYVVAVVDRRHAWLYRVSGQAIEPGEHVESQTVGSRRFAGWNGFQAYRNDQRARGLARQHYAATAAALTAAADAGRATSREATVREATVREGPVREGPVREGTAHGSTVREAGPRRAGQGPANPGPASAGEPRASSPGTGTGAGSTRTRGTGAASASTAGARTAGGKSVGAKAAGGKTTGGLAARAATGGTVAGGTGTPVVIGGHEAETAEFLAMLPAALRCRVAGTFVIDPHTMTPARVRQLAGQVIAGWEDERERQLARSLAGQPPGAMTALGLDACVTAANQHAVQLLVVPDDEVKPGFACESCGALAVLAGPCGVCGDATRGVGDVIEELAVKVTTEGGDFQPVRPDALAYVAARRRFPAPA
jgi:release factor family 10